MQWRGRQPPKEGAGGGGGGGALENDAGWYLRVYGHVHSWVGGCTRGWVGALVRGWVHSWVGGCTRGWVGWLPTRRVGGGEHGFKNNL